MKRQMSVYASVELFDDAEEQAKRKGITKSKVLTKWITDGHANSQEEVIEDLETQIQIYKQIAAERKSKIKDLEKEIKIIKKFNN